MLPPQPANETLSGKLTAALSRACSGGGLLVLLLFAWSFLLGWRPMQNTDIWWHLRTGQLIWERGQVPHFDWFSFIGQGQTWIDLHWGFQLLAAGIYALGTRVSPQWGINLLVLAKAFCLLATVSVGWFASCRDLPAWAKALCWILPIVCLSGRAVVRPEMLSLLFLATWLAIVARGENSPRLMWWLPLVQVVWTNCHGLFVLGLVVGGAYGIDRLVRHLADGSWGLEPVREVPSGMTVTCVCALVAVACLINPYFEAGALFPLELYKKFSVDRLLYMNIGEFQSPYDTVRHQGWILYFTSAAGLWLITVVSFLWLARERRLSAMRMLLFAAFSLLAWQATRNTTIFAVASAFVLCHNCGDALRLRFARKMRASQVAGRTTVSAPALEAGMRPRHRWLTVLLSLFIAVLILTNFSGHWQRLSGGTNFGLGEMPNWYAHAAARFAGQEGFPKRAFVAHLGQAAVYIFHNAPERRVFMDGRLEVAPPHTYRRYIRIKMAMQIGLDKWQDDLRDEQGNLPVVILDKNFLWAKIQGLHNTPGWACVYSDKTAAVFLEQKRADELGLPAVDPLL